MNYTPWRLYACGWAGPWEWGVEVKKLYVFIDLGWLYFYFTRDPLPPTGAVTCSP